MFGKTDIGTIDFARGFFHMIILNSIFGGLIIGKISEGEARFGLKHVVVLVAVGYIASALFILPPPVARPDHKSISRLYPGINRKALPHCLSRIPLFSNSRMRQVIP